MSPVLLQNHFHALNKPIDGGKTWRGKRLFGDHKTWRGLFVATAFGGFLFVIQYWVAFHHAAVLEYWWPFDQPLITDLPLFFGFGMGAAAICGDAIKSFFKRQFNVAPGKSWFPFDQIDFLLGATAFASLYVDFTWSMWLCILLVGPTLHILVNRVAYWMKLKNTPW